MWLILLNPQSGSGAAGRKRAEIEACLAQNGIAYSLRLTQYPQHATEIVRLAIENEGFRQIAAVGGDGTLNEVVNGMLLQTRVPSTDLLLAAIPLGTGNDWIRTHGIANDWRRAISYMRAPNTAPHDVGAVCIADKTSYFINIAGLAYDAFVVRYMTEQDSGKWLPRTVQYFYMIIRCLFAYEPQRIRVVLDDDTTIDESIYTVHVGICRYSGGGCTMTPHALPDDGLFAVTIVRKVSAWNAILSTPMFYNGKIGTHPQASTHSAKALTVSPTLVELDGELCANHDVAATFTILPHAIRIVVP